MGKPTKRMQADILRAILETGAVRHNGTVVFEIPKIAAAARLDLSDVYETIAWFQQYTSIPLFWHNTEGQISFPGYDYRPTFRGQPTPKIRNQILEKHECICAYCGLRGTISTGPDGRSWSIDHIVPVVRGGLTEMDNLCLSCATCNARKKDMDADDFRALLALGAVSK